MTVDQTSDVVFNETLSAVGNPTARKMYTKTDVDNAVALKSSFIICGFSEWRDKAYVDIAINGANTFIDNP